MTNTAPTFKVQEAERTYVINGSQLKKTLTKIGMTQSELARRCGYSNASRVCHLVKRGKTRIGGKHLKTMLKVLRAAGAEIEGFKW